MRLKPCFLDLSLLYWVKVVSLPCGFCEDSLKPHNNECKFWIQHVLHSFFKSQENGLAKNRDCSRRPVMHTIAKRVTLPPWKAAIPGSTNVVLSEGLNQQFLGTRMEFNRRCQ